MMNWQDKLAESMKKLSDKQSDLRVKAQQGMTLSAESVEKLAGYQLGLAAEGVDTLVTQVKLLGQPGTAGEYFERQAELLAESVQSVSGRAREFSAILGDSVADAAALFEFAAKPKAAPRAKKAA